MSRDTTVIAFRQPEAIDDPLSELAREGARRMLAQVLIAEADSFVAMWKDLKLPDGRNRIVRHGHGPHRTIQTGVGPVEVRRAKVRDRGEVGAEEKIRFTPTAVYGWLSIISRAAVSNEVAVFLAATVAASATFEACRLASPTARSKPCSVLLLITRLAEAV
jgi:hypothetical protein